MAKKRSRRSILPVWGYVLLNLVFAGMLAAFYLMSRADALRGKQELAGVFPVLCFCMLAFVAASIYDAIFDRVSLHDDDTEEEDLLTKVDPMSQRIAPMAPREAPPQGDQG